MAALVPLPRESTPASASAATAPGVRARMRLHGTVTAVLWALRWDVRDALGDDSPWTPFPTPICQPPLSAASSSRRVSKAWIAFVGVVMH